MPFIDIPSPTETLTDSRLLPAQQSTLFSSSDALADVSEKNEEAASVIERRLLAAASPNPFPFSEADLAVILPRYSAEQREDRAKGFLDVARTAVKWQALIYLYGTSGQLNKAYPDRADWFEEKLERLLTGKPDGTGDGGVLGEIRSMSEALTAGVADNSNEVVKLPFSVAPNRRDGYNTCEDEFSPCSVPRWCY